MLNKISRKLSTLRSLLYIKLREKKFENRLPYLFFNNHSDELLIVFSAFTGNKRRYNYVKGLSDCKYDRLYILDPWGYTGSYNLYDNGSNYPEDVTNRLITKILSWGGVQKSHCSRLFKRWHLRNLLWVES